VLAVAAVALLIAVLDVLVVSTALSTIRVDPHASVQQLEWTVSAYTLGFAVLPRTAAALGVCASLVALAGLSLPDGNARRPSVSARSHQRPRPR
jgi:MFS family permease